MEIIQLTDITLPNEHIACAISDKKCQQGYLNKKNWLQKEFRKGYQFCKFDVRGKAFIEYVPIESSWYPLLGKNFMVINCFWVAGQFKGKGLGRSLLEKCFADAQSMDGVVAISSDKKRPFMSDPKFLKHFGFEIVDEAPPFFKLWALKFNEKSKTPSIMKSAKKGECEDNSGITAYYSDACPFTDYYTGTRLKEYAAEKNIPLNLHYVKSKTEARKLPIPWFINSVFYKGQFVTIELKSEKALDNLI